MNTKNSTKRQLCCHLVEFLVFNSICLIISVPSDEANRVDQYNTFLIFPGRRPVLLFKGFSRRDLEPYNLTNIGSKYRGKSLKPLNLKRWQFVYMSMQLK